MRTATVFRPLLVGGVLVASAAIAWGEPAACAKASKAKSTCCAATLAATAVPVTPTPAAPAPAEGGMRAYLDPETGLIGGVGPADPTAVEPLQSAPVLREEVMPDGSVMLDLQGTMQEYTIMQIDADGNKVQRCVTDPAAALAEPVVPAKAVK